MIRYVIATIAGVIFSAAVFWILNKTINPDVWFIDDRWAIRMACGHYEAKGRVIESNGIPVENALIQADLGFELIGAISGTDGIFTLSGTRFLCDKPKSLVSIQVQSDKFEQSTLSVPFIEREIEIVLSERYEYTDRMNMHFTAIVKHEGDWWIGWIEEVPGVNCQEATREVLLDTLQVTLREALEFNRTDAIDAAGEDYEELEIAV